MDSPLLKFLEWFDDLPDIHQKIIVERISMADGSYNELSVHQMGTMDKYFKERIKRLVDKLQKTDQKLLKLPIYYKWEGIGLLLSLRSQIDFFLDHPRYYGLNSGDDKYQAIKGGKIKETLQAYMKNSTQVNDQTRESQLSEIFEKWNLYKSNFASDEYIIKYYLSL